MVYLPSGSSPLSFWVTFTPSSSGSPVWCWVSPGPRTTTNGMRTLPVNSSVISSTDSTVASLAGALLLSESCASAGPAVTRTSSAARVAVTAASGELFMAPTRLPSTPLAPYPDQRPFQVIGRSGPGSEARASQRPLVGLDAGLRVADVLQGLRRRVPRAGRRVGRRDRFEGLADLPQVSAGLGGLTARAVRQPQQQLRGRHVTDA